MISKNKLGKVSLFVVSSYCCSVSRSGKRKVTLIGTHLDLVDSVTHINAPQEVILPRNSSSQNLTYETPAAKNTDFSSSVVFLKVANQTLTCRTEIAYYPDPEFTSFTAVREGEAVRIVVQKKVDNLEMKTAELKVVGIQNEKEYPCILKSKESSNKTETFICEIEGLHNADFEEVKVSYGGTSVTLNKSSSLSLLILLVILLIPIIIIGVLVFYQRQQKQLTVKMNRLMEDLELDIRNDIRQDRLWKSNKTSADFVVIKYSPLDSVALANTLRYCRADDCLWKKETQD
ncbi:hypothetical protein CHARACLAT_025985 [Characodon lateralis]|uniref:Uncharacterized protein n=1 Tax=Characodon lateralis TaxID=208331 RepID=A0ABU7E3I3_9TELE|nr:hypothetical protein [Characodon lateralis]